MKDADHLRGQILAGLRPGSAALRCITALQRLPKNWPADDYISRLKRKYPALYNCAYNNFKDQAELTGRGRVATALWLAGVNAPAGMNRHTTIDQDLDILLAIITRARRCTEATLQERDSRTFHRAKRRAAISVTADAGLPVRASMKAVAYLLWKRDPSFDPARCFDHLPPGLYCALPRLNGPQWYWRDCATPGTRRNHYLDLIRRMHANGVAPAQFVPSTFAKLSDGAQRFLTRVNNDAHRSGRWNWGDLVEEATNLAYGPDSGGRSGAAAFDAIGHNQCLVSHGATHASSHKRLRSNAEACVDGVLAGLIGPTYPDIHAHDVRLWRLVPRHPFRRDEVDIYLRGRSGAKAVVEVSYGRPDPNYTDRLTRKLSSLNRAGILAVSVDWELAGKALVGELEGKLLLVLERLQLAPQATIPNALARMQRSERRAMRYPSYEDAVRAVREAGIVLMTEYKNRYSALGLPSNPNIYYMGRGYRTWGAFVGVERKPGRQKGVPYPTVKRRN